MVKRRQCTERAPGRVSALVFEGHSQVVCAGVLGFPSHYHAAKALGIPGIAKAELMTSFTTRTSEAQFFLYSCTTRSQLCLLIHALLRKGQYQANRSLSDHGNAYTKAHTGA